MSYYSKCPKCGGPIKQIPIRRVDTTVIIELYCEKCDESRTLYPKNGEIKSGHASFF